MVQGRWTRWVVPAVMMAAATARAQEDHNHGEGRTGPRIVEQYSFEDPEGRLMGYYSAALAFSPVAAPRMASSWGASFGLEASYLPALNAAQRSGGFSKTESTNLLPVIPRPRLSLTFPGGVALEGSWIPPLRVAGVKANLVSGAITRPFMVRGNLVVTPRFSATAGTVTGPITCNQDLQAHGGGEAVFYTHVCHDIESEDEFEPLSMSGEIVASRAVRRGSLTPYAGVGVRRERNTFDVGVRFSDGDPDPNHPILKMNATRGYGFLGTSWAGPRRSTLTGEMFYAPGSLLTARLQASVRLLGS